MQLSVSLFLKAILCGSQLADGLRSVREQERRAGVSDLPDAVDTPQQAVDKAGDEGVRKKILVLSDAGEEVDDEVALWFLSQQLEVNQGMSADVVFCTGQPMKRAMRWLESLSSVKGNIPGNESITYWVGPTTDRHQRYDLEVDNKALEDAFGVIQPYEGGEYDVVLQMSPLGGFEVPESGNALGKVTKRSGADAPMFVIVGAESSTNFPMTDVHIQFKEHLKSQGFTVGHLTQIHYASWTPQMLDAMPDSLSNQVANDEWNKAVGRIPPAVANLFVRFRVNTKVNFNVIDRAFEALTASFSNRRINMDADWVAAARWVGDGERLARIKEMVAQQYTTQSRAADDQHAVMTFGNPSMQSQIEGTGKKNITMGLRWDGEPNFSPRCAETIQTEFADDLAEKCGGILDLCTVDDIMTWAVTIMTQRLMVTWSFLHKKSGGELSDSEEALFTPYLEGSIEGHQALDFNNFPALPDAGEFTGAVQKQFVGNYAYDPTGMLVAMAAMKGSEQTVCRLETSLSTKKEIPKTEEVLLQALTGAREWTYEEEAVAC